MALNWIALAINEKEPAQGTGNRMQPVQRRKRKPRMKQGLGV